MQTRMISASPTRSAGSSDRSSPGDPFDAGPFAWARYPLPLAPRCAGRAGRHALVAMLVAWAPLAILSAIQGLAVGPTRHESFLLDFAAYGRYFVAVPIYVYATSAILPRMA